MSNVDSWCKACGEVDLPSELQDLEDGIHHHQGLYEHITAAYSEVTSHCVYTYDLQIVYNITSSVLKSMKVCDTTIF